MTRRHFRVDAYTRLGATLLVTAVVGMTANAAPIPGEKPERKIALKDVFTTTDQRGLRSFAFTKGEYGNRGLEGLKACLKHCQLETMFIVQGDDPGAALWDAWNHLTWVTERETKTERKARESSTRFWAVVFLGIGPSTPNQWTLRSSNLFTNRIEINCDTSERADVATTDICYYLYFIPLGEMKKGRYTLQIVNPSSGERLFMRKQDIGSDH